VSDFPDPLGPDPLGRRSPRRILRNVWIWLLETFLDLPPRISELRVEYVTPITVRLRELREARGLSQEGLAELAGVPHAAISELESARKPRLDRGILERLARALDVGLSELVRLEPVKVRHPDAKWWDA
jgi:DNA-binding Xre family transcriptional regulator